MGMSVDDRIREGLTMTDQHLRTPDTESAFDIVTRAGDRRTTRRRMAFAGAAAAAAAVVAIAVTLSTDDPTSSPTPSNPPTTSAPPTQGEAPASPIEGTWRSDPVSFEAMAANLRDNGLQASVPALRAELGEFGRTRITVTMVDGDETVLLGGNVASTSAYTLGAGTVTLNNATGWTGTTVLQDQMAVGMRLSFILITAPEGATGGLSNEALVRALYTTATFTKVDQ
jgi:hypothetical protein